MPRIQKPLWDLVVKKQKGCHSGVHILSYSFTLTPSIRELPDLPEAFSLSQNYPNPFNPSTVIGFQLTVGGPVSLTVWNMLGQRVATLVDEKLPSGKYETVWDAAGAASGTYFYRLTTNGFVQTRNMVLLR